MGYVHVCVKKLDEKRSERIEDSERSTVRETLYVQLLSRARH